MILSINALIRIGRKLAEAQYADERAAAAERRSRLNGKKGPNES